MKALCVPAVVLLALVRAPVPLLSSVAIAGLICAPVYGQWVKVPAGGIPKGPDGKPNLSAPARVESGGTETGLLLAAASLLMRYVGSANGAGAVLISVGSVTAMVSAISSEGDNILDSAGRKGDDGDDPPLPTVRCHACGGGV